MKSRISQILVFAILVVCVLGLVALYASPKSQVLSVHESYVGYYRGLGWNDGGGFFGKNWFRIVVREGDGSYWVVDVNGPGYAPNRGYYATGVLREEGVFSRFD
jgi:hypothetical protein